METYAYIVLVSQITPYGLPTSRLVPLDGLVTSLKYLKHFETYGYFFSYGHDVFECIAPVALFARKRLDEASPRDHCSQESRDEYDSLRAYIESLDDADPEETSDESRTAELLRRPAHLPRDRYVRCSCRICIV